MLALALRELSAKAASMPSYVTRVSPALYATTRARNVFFNAMLKIDSGSGQLCA